MENKTAELIEAFNEYAKHRRDKGTATAKINAWNHLVFRINEYKNASLHCADKQREIEELKKRVEELEDLVQQALNCADYAHAATIREIKKTLNPSPVK